MWLYNDAYFYFLLTNHQSYTLQLKHTNEYGSSSSSTVSKNSEVKDKGEVIMEVMNLLIKMKGHEYEMKTFLQQMQQNVLGRKQQKIQTQQYLRGFRGFDVNLSRMFLKDDMYRDLLHEVKIKNALAVVEDSID